MSTLRTIVLLSVCLGGLLAQKPFAYWPGAVYDPRIPTYQKVLGYSAGEQITSHAGLMRYAEALAGAAPTRVRLFEYAKSWEGRKLIYLAVGSEANINRLAEIRSAVARLADPRKTTAAEASKLISNLPAVVWIGAGVHGNENSSPEAALLAAYHLLASQKDPLVDAILAGALVLIDPTQNPDGRDRFVHHFEQILGPEPDPSPVAAEHNESWPGGRSNHYLFDMNRDWFALTQPETRGRVKALLEWYPLVFADLHEMGSDSTYFFAPGAAPFNPHLTKTQEEGLALFGKNHARWFDRFGFDYFTRDVFDEFYPGYGASWPFFQGAIGMTYEQATTRGLIVRRRDDSIMRFRDTIRHHFVATISTAETAAKNREKLLNDFYRYRLTAIEEGQTEPVREYILPLGLDAPATHKLAGLLAEEGVEVRRATAGFRAGEREFPAGTYVVSLAQPAKRLVRTLLDPNTPMDPGFLKEEERRRRRKLPSEIYDVTAWALPLLFNVEVVSRPGAAQGSFEPVKPGVVVSGVMKGAKATVAYLAPWNTASARLLTAALAQDLRVSSSDKPFTLNGAKYPGGTLIFKVAENPPELPERLAKLAASTGADVYGTDTSWVDEGANFGSRHVLPVRKPAVALAWDSPASSTSAGWTRFVLERQFNYPVTVIRCAQLRRSDLSKFQVLILPDTGSGAAYAESLGADGIRRVKEWVSQGGTLIGVGDAVSFLANSKVGLLAVAAERAVREKEAEKKEAEKKEPPADRVAGKLFANQSDFEKAIRADEEMPDPVPGVLVKARTDPDHWITAGVAPTVNAMVEGRTIFTPIKVDKGVNAATFLPAEQLVAGGYLWDENRKQLALKPLVIVQPEGRGNVIGFTAEPSFRAYLDGMNLLFLNAIFRGPAHARTGGME